jgi:hypothetical protein
MAYWGESERWGEMTDLGRGSAELAESPPKKRFVGEIKP